MLIDLEKHYYIVNNINGKKLRSMVEDKIDQCNIVLDEALRTGDDNLYSKTLSESHAFFQVLRMIFDLSLEVDKVQTEDIAELEEVPAQTEDKAEPEEVPAEDEDEAEPEEVPAEDEDEAEPEEVPAEDEDEAEPEQVLSNKKCFSNAHCCTSDCPNIRFDIAENRFGYGIAEDMGFKRISCKECYYNTGKCEDCLFFNGSECSMSSDPHVYHGLDEIPF